MKAELFFKPEMVALLKTIQRGDKFTAQQQIHSGLDLNIHGDEGITPLFWLLMEKEVKAVELALELGADPNFTATDGAHPVPMMTGNEQTDMLAVLLKHGGDANAVDRNGDPAIFGAIGMDDWDEINLLLKFGADLNKTNRANENSALHAAYLNKFKIVYKLIELGGAYHMPDQAGVTIAENIHDGLENKLLNPEFEAYGWALKVKALLIEKGIKFPPLTPQEVRERTANGQPIN